MASDGEGQIVGPGDGGIGGGGGGGGNVWRVVAPGADNFALAVYDLVIVTI